MRRRLTTTLLAALLVAGAAHGQPSDADKLYKDGVQMLRKGDIDGAVERFRLALELKRTPPLLFNLGQAVARQGHLAEAKQLLEEAKATAEKNGPKTIVDLSRGALADVDARYPRLYVELPANVSGVRVELDGKSLRPSEEGTQVEPGSHELTASADGYETFRQSYTLPERARRHVTIELKRQRSAAHESAAVEPAKSHTPLGPIVLGGVGVVALGGATLLFLQVKSIDNERRQLWQDSGCPGPSCPSGEPAHATDLREQAQSKARLGNILAGVGAAAVVGGGVWYFLSRPGREKREPAVSVVPAPGGAWVSGRF